jgi:hypothetical protein
MKKIIKELQDKNLYELAFPESKNLNTFKVGTIPFDAAGINILKSKDDFIQYCEANNIDHFEYDNNLHIPKNYKKSIKKGPGNKILKKGSENAGHNLLESNKEIEQCLQHPLECLVLTKMDERVGYGVFSDETILAGTPVAIYASEIIKPADEDEYQLHFPSNHPLFTAEENKNFSSKNYGNISRFFQH